MGGVDEHFDGMQKPRWPNRHVSPEGAPSTWHCKLASHYHREYEQLEVGQRLLSSEIERRPDHGDVRGDV
jgi:hypothetical protein